jgi:hypothetical protein
MNLRLTEERSWVIPRVTVMRGATFAARELQRNFIFSQGKGRSWLTKFRCVTATQRVKLDAAALRAPDGELRLRVLRVVHAQGGTFRCLFRLSRES